MLDEGAIEINATHRVTDKHLKGLRAFKEEGLLRRSVAVSLDAGERRTAAGIEILPWEVSRSPLASVPLR